MIGLLGYSTTSLSIKAIFVKELHSIAPNVEKKKILKELSIWAESISERSDTLAIAYVGASLPLLLLFSNTPNIEVTLNREIFAVEIIRIISVV